MTADMAPRLLGYIGWKVQEVETLAFEVNVVSEKTITEDVIGALVDQSSYRHRLKS